MISDGQSLWQNGFWYDIEKTCEDQHHDRLIGSRWFVEREILINQLNYEWQDRKMMLLSKAPFINGKKIFKIIKMYRLL